MLLYSLFGFVTPFPRNFFIKDNATNGRNPPFCPFSALMTHFSDITFINEETTGCINEEATGCINEEATGCINEESKGVITAPRNPPSFFLYLMFYCFSHTIN